MKQYMQIVTKEDKSTVEWRDEFIWSALLAQHNLNSPQDDDLRFTLYDTGTGLTECLFIDIDNVTYEQRPAITDIVFAEVGNYVGYSLSSGGGLHFYFLLSAEHYLGKEDFPAYRGSYRTLCARIQDAMQEQKLTGEVDSQCFSHKKLGRVPGSLNTKRGEHVRLIAARGKGCFPLKDTFKRVDIEEVDVDKVHDLVTPSKVMKYCPAVKHFRDSVAQYKSYELWFALASIYAGIGKIDMFKKISQKAITWDERAEAGIVSAKRYQYSYSCRKMKDLYNSHLPAFEGCATCRHQEQGSHPLFISGPRPTPTRKSGFVRRKKISAAGIAIPCLPHIVPQDVINQFLNDHEDTLVRTKEDSDFYMYRKYKWEWLAHRSLTRGDLSFREAFKKYPLNYRVIYTDMERLDRCLRTEGDMRYIKYEEFDTTPGIYFRNTVFLIRDKKLKRKKPSSSLMNRVAIERDYDPDAKCPEFQKFIEWVAAGSKYTKMALSYLFGLSISVIPTQEYQKFFWLTGNSGSGKSLIVSILREIIGHRNTATCGMVTSGNAHERPDLRSKLLFTMNDLKPHMWSKVEQARFYTYIQELTGDSGVSQKVAHVAATDFNPICTIVCTSNYSLTGVDSVPGIKRRYFPVDFWRVPEVEDSGLLEKLLKEVDGIYAYAVKGLKRYLECGFAPLYEYPEYSKLVNDAAEEDDDIFMSFVKEKYILGLLHDRISTTNVYLDYLDHAGLPPQDRGHRLKTSRHIKRALGAMLKLPTSKISYRSGGVNYYARIKRKPSTTDGESQTHKV